MKFQKKYNITRCDTESDDGDYNSDEECSNDDESEGSDRLSD